MMPEYTSTAFAPTLTTNTPAKFDLIWNTTLVCPWDCAVCCVDAVQVTKRGRTATLRSQGLTQIETISCSDRESHFDAALRHLQAQGRELTWERKLAVLDHLKGESVRLDISGGDALTIAEGRSLLLEAKNRLGRDHVTLTVTGAGLRECDIPMVADSIHEFNFTFDPGSSEQSDLRPSTYGRSNLRLAKKMCQLGVSVRAEMPLTRAAIDTQRLTQAYDQLAQAGVRELLLMRLFAVGRGQLQAHAIPSRSQYLHAIDTLRNLAERRGDGPKIKLQCALRHLTHEAGFESTSKNPCDLATKSFGIMANGTLLTSPWAIGPNGAPLDPSFVLGNLAETPFAQLRALSISHELSRRANENFGHCKIFAFQHSNRVRPLDKMLDLADPLFTPQPQRGVSRLHPDGRIHAL